MAQLFLAVLPWATHLILYYLNFLICKMELITVAPTTRTVVRIKYVTVAKSPWKSVWSIESAQQRLSSLCPLLVYGGTPPPSWFPLAVILLLIHC